MNGRYLYGVIPASNAVDFSTSLEIYGIEGARVRPIIYEKIAAVVHDCEVDLKLPEEKEALARWVIAHQDAIDKVWALSSVIVPASFGTIIKGDDPDKVTIKWLADNYEGFLTELKRFVGKAEYGVQIFWNPEVISSEIINGSEELTRLKSEIASSLPGKAYLYKQMMENKLKESLERLAEEFYKKTYEGIKSATEEIAINKLKGPSEGMQMIMDLSCLIEKGKETLLGDILEEIEKRPGYKIRFTGPWPPYSFVSKAVGMRDDEVGGRK